MSLEETARKHTLKNAVEHGGEARAGSVIGQVIQEADAEPETVQEIVPRIVEQVNSLDREEQRSELESYSFEEEEDGHDPLPDLKDAEEGEVVVRFAPNPNGPPHIGHARGMVINGELAEKYGGELVLRFDDTDPVKKRPLEDAYGMFEEDFRWLGYGPDRVVRSSENFRRYYEVAEELIEMGKAYVCKCPQEKAQELRKRGEACPCRDSGENMEKWREMLEGETGEGEAVLKVKTDIDHKNPAIRDFVAFRIIEAPDHPVTGDEHRAWPLLDFQGAVEDHDIGTTHIVRGKELRASTKRQRYIYDYLGWDYPEVRYWGNVQISGFEAPVSTSSLREMVESGELEGWDDPRAPTLRALRRRGFQPEAVRQFFLEMGVTENDVEASLDTLCTENRKLVEDSDRHFYVREPTRLEVSGLPQELETHLPLHPDHPERGERELELDTGDGKATVYVEVTDLEDGFLRLKGLCNVEVDGNKAEYVEGDHRKAVERDAPIIHWAPEGSQEVPVVMPDGSEHRGLLEPCSLDEGEVVQLERFGFARMDGDGKLYYAHG